MKKKVIVIGVLAVVAAIAFVLINIFFDYIAVKEIGDNFTQVFWTDLSVKSAAQAIGFVSIFLLLYISALIVKRNLLKLNIGEKVLSKKWVIRLVTVVMALLSSSVVSETVYSKFLLFINTVWFGKADPIFNLDIGYYVFQRPFMMSCLEMILSVWYVIILFCVLCYLLFCCVFGEYRIHELLKQRAVALHNIINILIALALNCMTYKFKAEDILYHTFGQVTGAGYTDINIWLKYYRLAPFALIVIVITAIIFTFKRKLKNAVITMAVFPVLTALSALIAFGVQGFIITPNEVIMESKYIQNNMDFTRAAYGLDKIQEKEFEVKNNLTPQDIKENADTINNIRIIDFPSTLTSANQLQGIRNYYRFHDLDIVPYKIGGKNTSVAIAAREMSKENLKDSTDNFANEKMRYTHGIGVVMMPTNQVTEQGQPHFLIKDIPPRSMEGAPYVNQPRIYYGELTNDYVIVNNEKYKELDYSEEQRDIEFKYDGKSGMRFSFINRLLFTIHYGDFRMLITDLAGSDSKILINRNIKERVSIAAPFLRYDSDPYILIDKNGRLKWIIDAYASSSYYPYAQYDAEGNFNYIRNSARAVVDAYDGTVELYIIDESDPVIMAYSKMYPSVFKNESFPEDLAEHLRYPEYLFKIKADIYAKYHVSNATTFYNKNDFWAVSKEKFSYKGEIKDIEPYYNMMDLELGDGKGQELVLMLPYSLTNKDNMVAWMAVRCEGANYGEVLAYKFQKDVNIYGALQMENRIDSDPSISKELSLWGQGGSNVIRGNMLIIPVKQSLFYVEPVYITSINQASMPELKMIAVGYNDRIVMTPTLEQAIALLFDTKTPQISTVVSDEDTLTDAINRTILRYYDMRGAAADNDWQAFGQSMKDLQEAIASLEAKRTELSHDTAAETEEANQADNTSAETTPMPTPESNQE